MLIPLLFQNACNLAAIRTALKTVPSRNRNPNLSKKLQILNSPWDRQYERISDCQRWLSQGHAVLKNGAVEFTAKFIESCTRQRLEIDPVGYDDGVSRRWVKRSSGGQPVLQLRPVKDVGVSNGVYHAHDDLIRRQYKRDKGRSVHHG